MIDLRPSSAARGPRREPARCGTPGIRVLGCLVLVGCWSSTHHAPAPDAPAADGPRSRWRDAPPGPTAYAFDDLRGFAYRNCTASAPPEITLELQAHPAGKAPFAIALELHHGPDDRVPRALAVGGSRDDRCDPGCTGTVWIDELVPGKHMRVRIDLSWPDGMIAHQRLVVPWRGGAWAVRACPTKF